MTWSVRAIALCASVSLFGCANPALDVTSHSLSRACVGASIGAATDGSVSNVGDTPMVGQLRVRWMLSSDGLPSTDDVPLLGFDADVTRPALAAGASFAIASPNLIVPSDARLGPQYLILAAVDLGATSAGVSYSATPITIDQCPSAGACDAAFETEALYLASPERSGGPLPRGRHGERPVFVSDKSTLALRGSTVGGFHGLKGLLLRYRADRSFVWAKTPSHCVRDSVQSIATFNDGTLAVTSSYYTGSRQESILSGYSQAGTLLWQRALLGSASSCSATCSLSQHAVVAVDPSDDTAVTASSDGYGSAVVLARFDRFGNELAHRSYTSSTLELNLAGGPYDIATYRFATGARSEVLLGFPLGALLLGPSLDVRWVRPLAASTPGEFAYSDVEVEICSRSNLYIATTGVEYFSGQDVVRNFDAAGVERWAIELRTGATYGAAPAYTGPLGLLRPDRFALSCNEQDLPSLAFFRTEAGSEFPREVRAVTLLNDGRVTRRYRGLFPAGRAFAGASGIDASVFDFLALTAGKFSLQPASALGYTRY
jgi:hypothetical protein